MRKKKREERRVEEIRDSVYYSKSDLLKEKNSSDLNTYLILVNRISIKVKTLVMFLSLIKLISPLKKRKHSATITLLGIASGFQSILKVVST